MRDMDEVDMGNSWKIKRVVGIEGLRGLAGMIVFFSHFGLMFYPAYYWGIELCHFRDLDYKFGQTPLAFIVNGNSAVLMFLMIAGFGTYYVYQKGMVKIRKYLVLRYFKLVVMAMASVLLTWVLVKTGLTFYQGIMQELKSPCYDTFNPLQLSPKIVLMYSPLSSSVMYNGALWTMPFFFYGAILSVLLCFLSDGVKKRIWIYIVAVAIVLNLQQLYYLACIVGVALADFYNSVLLTRKEIAADSHAADAAKAPSQRNYFSRCMGFVFVLLGIYLCAYPTGAAPTTRIYSWLPFAYCFYYHLIGTTLLILAILLDKWIERVMSMRMFQFLGKYSMAIYLVHSSVLISFSPWMYTILRTRLSYNRNVFYVFIASNIVVLAGAVVFKRIIDMIYLLVDKVYEWVLPADLNKIKARDRIDE